MPPGRKSTPTPGSQQLRSLTEAKARAVDRCKVPGPGLTQHEPLSPDRGGRPRDGVDLGLRPELSVLTHSHSRDPRSPRHPPEWCPTCVPDAVVLQTRHTARSHPLTRPWHRDAGPADVPPP